MTDLTNYSNQELSLLVFNTQFLYDNRHEDWFLYEISQMYVYTEDQMKELLNDLAEDKKETEQ